jgi:uncharacterized protein (TIGR02118 family)
MPTTSTDPVELAASADVQEADDSAGPRGRFLVLYGTPTDPQAFEDHYLSVHVPLAKRLPGLRRYAISRDVTTVRGGETYYLVAQLDWDSIEELRAAFASPEGRATAEDMVHLAALAAVQSVVLGNVEVL